MGSHLVAIVGVVLTALTAQVRSEEPPKVPQIRGATYEEILAHQALGRVVLAHDDTFILYEWMRPYEGAPEPGVQPVLDGSRKQTFLYRVSTTTMRVESKYLFIPQPRNTYYLGSLSPDSKYVSFYEIDRDQKRVRAGVAETSGRVLPKITWFPAVPDHRRLDLPARWISNTELVYRVNASPTRFVRADATTGKAEPCGDCASISVPPSRLDVDRSGNSKSNIASKGFPAGSKVVARSESGELEVIALDTAQLLELWFRKNGRVRTIFENPRAPPKLDVIP